MELSAEEQPQDGPKNRLRLAAGRFEDAQRERVLSIVDAKRAGMPIRRIAESIGLSASRVHQLLQEHSADESPCS